MFKLASAIGRFQMVRGAYPDSLRVLATEGFLKESAEYEVHEFMRVSIDDYLYFPPSNPDGETADEIVICEVAGDVARGRHVLLLAMVSTDWGPVYDTRIEWLSNADLAELLQHPVNVEFAPALGGAGQLVE